MSPDRFVSLRALAEALPDDAAVPVPKAWLLELLDAGNPDATPQVPSADLTVAQVAARFERDPSTVRGWVAAGQFPEAYRLQGRELRIPLAAVLAFEARQRTPGAARRARAPARRSRKPADLGAWRKIAS